MKKKILIIDDSALMRRVICDIISSDDRFEVVDTAHDGVEGFNLICRNHYDAIVLDIYMPRMTGLELLMEMQKSRISAFHSGDRRLRRFSDRLSPMPGRTTVITITWET